MNGVSERDAVARAADLLMAAVRTQDPEVALARAREIEAAGNVGEFARLVREELERRCLNRDRGR